MSKPSSIKLLEILCGIGGNVESLGRAGVRRLELAPDGSLTLVMGDGTFAPPAEVSAPAWVDPEPGEASATSPEAGEEQGGEDDLDTAHLDP